MIKIKAKRQVRAFRNIQYYTYRLIRSLHVIGSLKYKSSQSHRKVFSENFKDCLAPSPSLLIMRKTNFQVQTKRKRTKADMQYLTFMHMHAAFLLFINCLNKIYYIQPISHDNGTMKWIHQELRVHQRLPSALLSLPWCVLDIFKSRRTHTHIYSCSCMFKQLSFCENQKMQTIL